MVPSLSLSLPVLLYLALLLRMGVCLHHVGTVVTDVGLSTAERFDSQDEFAQGLLDLVQSRMYDKKIPVVVTLADDTYSQFLTPWSHQVAACGMTQQVIVTLGDGAVVESAANNLPVLTQNGSVVGRQPRQPGSLLALDASGPNWQLPGTFSELKMLTPRVLLNAGFQTVIVSEADVFWLTNPLMLVGETGDFAAMKGYGYTGPDRESKLWMNIGFMIFTGRSCVGLLDRFLNEWDAFARKTEVAQDQTIFNELLETDSSVRVVSLPSDAFAVQPQRVGVDTTVVHCARVAPTCKTRLLNTYYANATGGQGRQILMSLTNDVVNGNPACEEI
jgi:hypothetical protein